MSFDPFRGGSDGSSLEHDDPLSNAVKQSAKAVNNQTQQQAQAVKQSFTDQLYGNVANPTAMESLDSGTDESQSGMPQQQHTQAQPQSSQHGLQPAANPEEQAKLDETRRKIAELHKKTYFDETFGEAAQQKRRQREQEEEERRQQEEQEKAEDEEQKRQAMAESLNAMSAGGKGKGPNQLGDVALNQAKTKTEVNRGSSG